MLDELIEPTSAGIVVPTSHLFLTSSQRSSNSGFDGFATSKAIALLQFRNLTSSSQTLRPIHHWITLPPIERYCLQVVILPPLESTCRYGVRGILHK